MKATFIGVICAEVFLQNCVKTTFYNYTSEVLVQLKEQRNVD